MGAFDEAPQITWASEHHLRLDFGAKPDERLSAQLNRALKAVERARLRGLIGITPASTTLLLEFDLVELDEQRSTTAVRTAIDDDAEFTSQLAARKIEIPVCYDPSCGPDIDDVVRIQGITRDEIIRLHSEAQYSVQFIGFAPGFGYLSGLPHELNTPRLETPRPRIPAGSVGIAGDQSAVYPGNTAGGWRLIGRTPLRMFDARRANPSLLTRGDHVHFVPISLAEFNAQMQGAANRE